MRTPNAYIQSILADFYPAKQAWWEAAEYETRLYATELAEYKETHPMPRLADFMKARKAEREAAEAEAAREAAYLAWLEDQWLAAEVTAEAESIVEQEAAEALSIPARVVRTVVRVAVSAVSAVRRVARKLAPIVSSIGLTSVKRSDSIRDMNTATVTIKRPAPNHTNVYVDGRLVGRIVRRTVSNSSVRGGAYRDMYYTVDASARYTVPHYTRKEAIAAILGRPGQ